jgi:hypothetical protein
MSHLHLVAMYFTLYGKNEELARSSRKEVSSLFFVDSAVFCLEQNSGQKKYSLQKDCQAKGEVRSDRSTCLRCLKASQGTHRFREKKRVKLICFTYPWKRGSLMLKIKCTFRDELNPST